MRAAISIVLGLLLLAGAYFGMTKLIDSKKQPKARNIKTVKTVYTREAKNQTIPILIEANGTLAASTRIELYSEVQGIFKPLKKSFKPGQRFNKGELLLEMDSREFYSSLVAQRSLIYDNIISLMPDLKFDYPESFGQWKAYLDQFDIENNIKPLPEPKNDQEKYFVNGKQIVSSYYNIKNLEERLLKYKIYAPFSGVLTEALVDPGTLIRQGQKLGELINTGSFELEAQVSQQYLANLRKGKKVVVKELEGDQSWQGYVKRINEIIDPATQTVSLFIQVSGRGLTEGQFLQAEILAKDEPNVMRLNRSLITQKEQVFYVKNDSILSLMDVTPVHFTDEYALVRGITEGTALLDKPLPGAYEGMIVKIAIEE